MTSLIDLSAILANVVIVLVLAAVVAHPRVSQVARLGIATFGFTCAWLINGVFDATRPPGWTVFMGGAVIVVSIVVVIATLQFWTQADDGAKSQPQHPGDEGGGGPRRRWPDAPQHGGGGSDPSWWPEFEHGLATYVAARAGEATVSVAQAEPARAPCVRDLPARQQESGMTG